MKPLSPETYFTASFMMYGLPLALSPWDWAPCNMHKAKTAAFPSLPASWMVKAAAKAPPAKAPEPPPAKASGKAAAKPPETETPAEPAPAAPAKAAVPKAAAPKASPKASPKNDVKAKTKAATTVPAPEPAPAPAALKRPAGHGNLGNMFKKAKTSDDATELPDLDALMAAEEDAEAAGEEGEGEEEEAAEDDTEVNDEED